MRLTIVATKSFPLQDQASFDACQVRARAVLVEQSELTLADARTLCEFLDYPQADDVSLQPDDPLRFATVRVMGFLRLYQDSDEAAQLCRFSPTARDLLAMVQEEPLRARRSG